jgi:N utilization substance protein B
MKRRRKARELALKLLYQHDLSGAFPEDILEGTELFRGVTGASADYAREIFLGAARRLPEIDRLIGDHSRRWKLSRIAAIDRNLLRLAVFELLSHTEIPAAVIIDEALEIARKYSDDEAPKFVNGILDAILHAEMAGRTVRT